MVSALSRLCSSHCMLTNMGYPKHRYPFHNKVLCVCLWARPGGRDTDTGVSFTAPPALSANYSHVCQHAMWRTEHGECRDHYTPSGKISGLDLWGLVYFPQVKRKGGIDCGTINVYNLTKHKLLLSDLRKRYQGTDWHESRQELTSRRCWGVKSGAKSLWK